MQTVASERVFIPRHGYGTLTGIDRENHKYRVNYEGKTLLLPIGNVQRLATGGRNTPETFAASNSKA